MKQNGNNNVKKEYYIGLDVGTNSVGWAVADKDYNVKRFHGKDMWGARLFDEAEDASARRAARTNRRRIARRNWRLRLLEELFAEEITKTDRYFFNRLHESSLVLDDKSEEGSVYSLFADAKFTDKDYMKKYPTIYHLRHELIHSSEPHDARLVFLALHHLIKSRGHFLYESSGDGSGKTLDQALEDLTSELESNDISFCPEDKNALIEVLKNDETLTAKKSEMKQAYGTVLEESEDLDIGVLLEMLTGAKVQLAKLFKDESLKDADTSSLSLKEDFEEKLDELGDTLGTRLDIILAAKSVYDVARLSKILGNNVYISDAKIELYNKNRKDIAFLKKYIKKHNPDKYKDVFNVRKGSKNFAAYMRYKTDEKCTQEDFCSFIKPYIESMKASCDENEKRIYQEVSDKSFLTKLKGTDNGLIPYQIQLKELDAILANASSYLLFLNETDEYNQTVKDKIRSIFTFRIPYFVGPLNRKSPNSWVERTDEKIVPWNFKEVVDEEASANAFMENLIGRCTYTGEPVLPLNSLLYSKFMVLNEINPIKINGQPLPVDVKQKMFEDLFVLSKKKVRKKTIINYLLSCGCISKDDEVSGVDDEIKSNLKPYHDFRQILENTKDERMVEDIIKSIIVFSDNKKMLENWLKKNTHDLSSNDIKYIMRLKYTGWACLSRQFLTGIYSADENGECFSIMDLMWNTNNNLMQLLSDSFSFRANAEAYKNEHNPSGETIRDRLDDLYIAPAVRRSIWQTVKIVDELVDIEKGAPAKIFIEMARGSAEEMKKKRTESRKMKLLALYQSCKKQEKELYEKLENETDQSLRRDKLFLYYLQMGKCMYSGENIDLDKLLHDNETYDIDHIFPRSRIKDDSLNNRVLVKSELNREKTNKYPIEDNIRNKMHDFWSMLHDKELISDVKYERLIRHYPLTEEELTSFVARQLIITQQSTKALADTLAYLYPNTRIVYSKAGNVSDFRQEFKFIKCREINDLHHAKDAYLNIVVGNVYDTKFTEKFMKNIQSENYSLNRVFDFNTPDAWNKDGSSISTVKKYMKKNTPIVTFMPSEYKGKLSNLTILPKKNGQLQIKKGKEINKYGGYGEVFQAYSCVVEHTDKEKRIRTIEPVYYYCKEDYEKNPTKYCVEILGLKDPSVICSRLLPNCVLEMDGIRFSITARSNDTLWCKHLYQFAVDDEHAKYIKELKKYIERNKNRFTGDEAKEFINKDDNEALVSASLV